MTAVRSRVRLEVAFVAGQEVAALAGLGILEVREDTVDPRTKSRPAASESQVVRTVLRFQ